MASLYTLLLVYDCHYMKSSSVGFAKEQIYGTGWFVALWMLLALLSVYYIVKARLHKRMAECCPPRLVARHGSLSHPSFFP